MVGRINNDFMSSSHNATAKFVSLKQAFAPGETLSPTKGSKSRVIILEVWQASNRTKLEHRKADATIKLKDPNNAEKNPVALIIAADEHLHTRLFQTSMPKKPTVATKIETRNNVITAALRTSRIPSSFPS